MRKHKMILDPDADGEQWLYRGCTIIKHVHPKLLLYSASTTMKGRLVGAASTLKEIRLLIDNSL